MDRQSIALYHDLLEDLSPILSRSILAQLERGEKVERWPDITPRQVAALALSQTFFKKFKDDVDASADANALRKFLSANKGCEDWELPQMSSWEEEAMGTVKKYLYNFFYPNGDPLLSSFNLIFERGRCGPGTSVGTRNSDFYTKMYSSTLSTTSAGLYRAYRSYTTEYPAEADADNVRQAYYGDAEVVTGNRLSFVPKQRSISRCICTEPVLNMYGQLGIGALIEGRLKSVFGIDLSLQPEVNRELARVGSLTGQFFTIDLESASDSISYKMAKYVLPREVFAWLDLFRSPTTTLPDGSLVKQHMLSSMGNGFTFPLQTLIFASVVSAAFDMHGLKRRNSRLGTQDWTPKVPSKLTFGNWGVFGDDIIAPVEIQGLVRRLLRLLGFTVNVEKSFFEGPFRESCGGDFFSGHPVRGVYVKTLRTLQSRVVVLNRLHLWSSVTGIYLTKVCARLLKTVPKRFVPPWENDDAGIKVPYNLVESMKLDRDTNSVIYRKWVAKTRRFVIQDERSLTQRQRIYNPSGLLLSFLRGYLRDGRISSRQEEITYQTKCAVSPNWDAARKLLFTENSWQRWNTAVWLTIKG